MSRNKSILIARADLKMALKVRYVKYSFLFTGLFGPILAILMITGPLISMSPSSSDYDIIVSMMIPMGSAMLALMAVVPAGLISANAFVGEKEQRTLEPLLLTPLTDQQIILGKILSSFIPCIALLTGGTLFASFTTNLILLIFGRPPIFFPDLAGLFLILAVGPIVVLAIISSMILLSSRVSKVYEAYQTGSVASLILLIPMILPLMTLNQNIIDPNLVWFSNLLAFAIAIIVASSTWAIAVKQFNRDRMVSLI